MSRHRLASHLKKCFAASGMNLWKTAGITSKSRSRYESLDRVEVRFGVAEG